MSLDQQISKKIKLHVANSPTISKSIPLPPFPFQTCVEKPSFHDQSRNTHNPQQGWLSKGHGFTPSCHVAATLAAAVATSLRQRGIPLRRRERPAPELAVGQGQVE